MQITKITNLYNENLNSRDYLLCALSEIAFGNNVELDSLRPDKSSIDSKLSGSDLEYWWFCGLIDSVCLENKCENVLRDQDMKYDYPRNIDLYCNVLKDKNLFSLIASQAQDDRRELTNKSDSKSYYLFNQELFEQAFNNCNNIDERIDKIIEIYDSLKINKPDPWLMSLESFPVKRIIGHFIYTWHKDISSDEFTNMLDRSVKVIGSKKGKNASNSMDVSNTSEFSFITDRFVKINNETKRKDLNVNVAEGYGLTFYDVLAGRKAEAAYRDKDTGRMISLDSQRVIGKEYDDDLKPTAQKFVDLNKSLCQISELNGSLSSRIGNFNILSVLESEINCSNLVRKLNQFSAKIYGSRLLKTVEGAIYGTEASTVYNNLKVSGQIKSFYNAMSNINVYNFVHVFHILDSLSESDKIVTNNKQQLVSLRNGIISGASSKVGMILQDTLYERIEDLREKIVGDIIFHSRIFWDKFFIYLEDFYDASHDRVKLPGCYATSENELYIPIPYTKDSNDCIKELQTIYNGFNAFRDIKEYCEATGKDLSTLQYFRPNNSTKHLVEKKGGLVNLQNGVNEFIESTQNGHKVNKYDRLSLKVAEDLGDSSGDNFSELVNSIKSKKILENNPLATYSIKYRSSFNAQIEAMKVSENELFSVLDIFCDKPNRDSVKLQSFVWKRCNILELINYSASFKDSRNALNMCKQDLLTFDLYDGIFMRYNGDVPGGPHLGNQTYFNNFSDMTNISKSYSKNSNSDSVIIESSRLLNFGYLKSDDFLDVSKVYREFILPCLINIEEGVLLHSLTARGNLKQVSRSIKMNKYIKVGVKLSMLILESDVYDLSFIINDSDIITLCNNCIEDLKSKFGISNLNDYFDEDFISNVFRSVIVRLKQLRLLLLKSIQYCEDLVDLCETFSNLFSNLSKSDEEVGLKDFTYLVRELENLGDLTNLPDVIQTHDFGEVKTNSIVKYWFYERLYDKLTNFIFRKFSEFGGDDSNLFSKIESDSTELVLEDDDELSWFYACSYLCHVTSRNYSILCDIAHDAYLSSLVTTVDNGAGIGSIVASRCAFVFSARVPVIEKLHYNFSRLKSEKVQRNLTLNELHKLADFGEFTLKFVNDYSEEIVNKFKFMINKVGSVNSFTEYKDRIVDIHVSKLRELGFDKFNKTRSNFSLSDNIVTKINNLVKSTNEVGKFRNNSINVLKRSVKNTGLYRTLIFDDDSIGKIRRGNDYEIFILHGYTGGSTGKEELIYLVHKEGFFVEIDLETNNVRLLDTVVSITMSSSQNYNTTVAKANDINSSNKLIFESIDDNGVVGFDTYTNKGQKIREVLIDHISLLSESVGKLKGLGLDVNNVLSIETKDESSHEVDNTESTDLVINEKAELRMTPETLVETKKEVSSFKFEKSVLSSTLSTLNSGTQNERMLAIMKEVVKDDCSRVALGKLLDKAALDGINREDKIKQLGLDGLTKPEQDRELLEDKWNSSYSTLADNLDAHLDTERKVNDFGEMYSSRVPYTVRRN